MSDGDRHHSQPVHTTDLLAREPGETAEHRVLDGTKKQAEESIFDKLGKTIDRQNRALADLVGELRYQREAGPDQQLQHVVDEMRTKLIAVEARSHVNEAVLSAVVEVRDAIRELTTVVRSALNGAGGQHT